jgi:hypothetical protein
MGNWITPALAVVYGFGIFLALVVLGPIVGFFGYIIYRIFTM